MSKPGYTVYTKDFANMVCRRLERENKKKDKEIERLNNIINELEKWVEYQATHTMQQHNYYGVLNKIKELKESDKE